MAVAAATAWVAAQPSEMAGLFAAVLEVMPRGETRNAIEKAAALGADTNVDHVGGIVAMHPGERGIPEEWRQHREPLSAMLRLEAPPR